MTLTATDRTTFADEAGAVVLEPKIPSAPRALNADGERTLPPTFADAFGAEKTGGERLLREMKREPTIRFGDNTIRALVCEGNHRIVSARPEPDAATMDPAPLAEATTAASYRDFCVRMLDGLRRPFGGVLFHAMDAFLCGHKLFEAEVAVVDGELRAVDFAPKPRTAYSLRVTRSNLLLGAIPTGKDEADMVPAPNLFVFSIGGEDDDPRGERALDSAYDAYYRKNVARPVELKSLETRRGGLAWAECTDPNAPKTVTTIVGHKTDGTPIEKTESAHLVVARELSFFRSGRLATLPAGWTLKFFDPQGNGGFSDHYDRCDREMLMALLIAARALLEAQHGSKADSETAGGFLESLRDFLRGLLCGAVAAQIFLPFLIANYGEDARRLCPRYEISTVEQSDNSRALYAYNAAFRVLTNEQRRALQSALNLPVATDEDMDSIVAALLAQAGGGSGNGGAATFSKASEFKNARSPQDGLASELKKRDGSLRALLKRFAGGDSERTDVEDEAARILQAGHEAAVRFGLKASGSKARKVAEDYLSETVTAQLEFFAELLDGVEDESVSAAMAQSRARNFARRMRGTANAAFHESSPDDATFTWELGANEQHCKQCPRYASMTADAPWLKDEVLTRPGECETECRCGCKCRLVRGDGAEGFGPVDFGPLGDDEDDKE